MKRYITPDMEMLILQNDEITTSSLPVIDGYDPADSSLNVDSRDYDPEYARSLGLL